MDPLTFDIREVAPTDAAIAPLIERHLTLMYASSPACSVHAMDASSLSEAGARFFAAFDGEDAVAIGALKILSEDHGELKSMHVRDDLRGAGLADAMLVRLIDAAAGAGLTRVSLETGSQEAFAPARAFYARNGFVFCAPFEGYVEDAASVFMTRAI